MKVISLGKRVIGFYGRFHNILNADRVLIPWITYIDGAKQVNIKGYFFLELDPVSGPKTYTPQVPRRGDVIWAATAVLEDSLDSVNVEFLQEDPIKIVPGVDEFLNWGK